MHRLLPIAALAAALALISPPRARAQAEPPPPGEAIPAPIGARPAGDHLAAPAEPESGRPLSAADLYADKCKGCHGEDGRAHTKYALKHKMPSFADAAWQKDTTDGEIVKAITFGIVKKDKKLMPSFKDKLSSDEMMSLVPYLRAFAAK